MKRTSNYKPHSVIRENRDDGSILLSSTHTMSPVVENSGVWLHHWAQNAADRIFLAERDGIGWRTETYADVLEKVRAIASSLLARNLDGDTPIMIMSGNGVDNALISLAAHYIGVPTVPVAEQYSLIPKAHARLQHAIELVRPAMAYVIDAVQFAEALKLDALSGIEIVSSRVGNSNSTPFSELLKCESNSDSDIDAAHQRVTADTVVKILMTSGSTSLPKGVPTTNRMICSNQSQLADALPFLRDRPPILLDWLPWNHVFGGSHNFYMVLANGGTLYIDDGKPVAGLFDRTIENLRLITGTLSFNVPVGYQMLLDALKQDATLRHRFFENLDLIFYSGASLPQDIWEAFESMALEVKGEVPLMTSSWGLTETAPAVLMQQEPTDRAGVVGVPMNGIQIKLLPDNDMRCEIRVKGPNIMPGYFKAPNKSKDAFDDEGYFITGDAMQFVDINEPDKGLRFDGRLSEDFKLLSGTWVQAAKLRLQMLSCLSPLAADMVITGADRNQIGLMIFPNRKELKNAGYSTEHVNGCLTSTELMNEVKSRLVKQAASAVGSSTRVTRALLMSEPPSFADAEITAKGNLNFRRVLQQRADLLQRLYDDTDTGVISL